MIEKAIVFSRVSDSAYQQEQDRIKEFVDSVKVGIATYSFLNLFAPPGYGKTVLLEHTWRNYERVLPTSFVSIKKFYEHDTEIFALRDLLRHIIRELADRLPKRIVSSTYDCEKLTNEKQLAEIIVGLVSSAKEFEKATLLLMGDYDAMPDEQQGWMEENVFSQIVRAGSVAVILTSQREVRFKGAFDLRMRIECRKLEELSAEAISYALPEEYKEIAGDIHLITGGLPVFTEKFVKQLETAQVTTVTDFHTREQELVKEYHRTYVEEVVLANLAADIRETVLSLSLLRRFDVGVLGKILPMIFHDSYGNYNTFAYLDLVNRLGSWVEWRMQGGYALNRAFGVALKGYVRLEKPDLYEKVNRAAIALYRELLNTKEFKEYHLVELLYHLLCLFKYEGGYGLSFVQDQLIQAKLGDELLTHLRGELGVQLSETDLDSLRNALRQDADLRDYMPKEVSGVIENMMKTKASELSGK